MWLNTVLPQRIQKPLKLACIGVRMVEDQSPALSLGQENCSVTVSSLPNLMLRFLNKMECEVITLDKMKMQMEITILIRISLKCIP